MLNLLNFRDKALYADGQETSLTGREAYALYGRAMSKLVADAGGELVFSARVRGLLNGEVDANWDAVGVMKYPSFKAMAAITSSPEHRQIPWHRSGRRLGAI